MYRKKCRADIRFALISEKIVRFTTVTHGPRVPRPSVRQRQRARGRGVSSVWNIAVAMGKKSRSAFAVGVFALSALVTYNIVAIAHGHATASKLGHHMDSHIEHLDDKHDAFSFEPRVVAKAGEKAGSARGSAKSAREGHVSDVNPSSIRASSATKNQERTTETDDEDVRDRASREQTLQNAQNAPNAPIDAVENDLEAKGKNASEGTYHVLLTANDSPYQRWQSRVMYYQYRKVKSRYPGSALGGFTRILHSGRSDGLMDEIPTVIVDALPKNIRDEGYVVLHRPYAFKQWLEKFAEDIPEAYVLMSEPDHLFIAPPPLLASETNAVAFPFFYIAPNDPKYAPIVQRFNAAKAPPEAFAPIGSSPVMISLANLRRVVPAWHELAVAMKKDKEADEAFGWVVEMWAYSIAAAQVGVKHETLKHFMLQPPYDKKLTIDGLDAFIIHYTYGDDFDGDGAFTPGLNQGSIPSGKGWHFDKREYTNRAPRRGEITVPPANAGECVKMMVEIINEAIDALPNWGL